ncbi:hypothetical protein PoB_007180000, partial [Plakobranchus ocellatus]
TKQPTILKELTSGTRLTCDPRPSSRHGESMDPHGRLSSRSWSDFGFGFEVDFCIEPVHNKVISSFQAINQARALVAGLETTTEGFLQTSGGSSSHCATDAPNET